MYNIKRVAIIDSYSGNGHCYSFPAIMNGWNATKAYLCPFKNINDYLSSYTTPDNNIKGVFHAASVWMSNFVKANDISSFAQIQHVASSPLEAAKLCDVIFLLNDEPDARNSLLKSLVSAEKPIFVDKLLARSTSELEDIRSAQVFKNQIFSASGIRYSSFFDFVAPFKNVSKTFIQVPNSWKMYGVHAVEMFLDDKFLANSSFEVLDSIESRETGGRILSMGVKSKSDHYSSLVQLEATGEASTSISVKQIGFEGEVLHFVLADPFTAFVRMMLDFNEYSTSNARVETFWANQRRVIELLSQ